MSLQRKSALCKTCPGPNCVLLPYHVASESTSLVKDSHLDICCQLDLLELVHRDPMAKELHHAAGQGENNDCGDGNRHCPDEGVCHSLDDRCCAVWMPSSS